jgi:hypothetical protein
MAVHVNPPPYKVTNFFHCGKNGWSESLWLNATSQAQCRTLMQTYLPLRLALSCKDVTFDALRVSDTSKPRKAELYGSADLGLATVVGTYFESGDDPAEFYSMPAEICLISKYEDNQANKVYIRYHGVPRRNFFGVGSPFGEYVFDVAYNTAFNAWSVWIAGASGAPGNVMVKQPTVAGVTTFSAITLLRDWKLSSHKVGRIFDVALGRRPVA